MYKLLRNVISPLSVITFTQVILFQALIPLPGGSSRTHRAGIKQPGLNYDASTSTGPHEAVLRLNIFYDFLWKKREEEAGKADASRL